MGTTQHYFLTYPFPHLLSNFHKNLQAHFDACLLIWTGVRLNSLALETPLCSDKVAKGNCRTDSQALRHLISLLVVCKGKARYCGSALIFDPPMSIAHIFHHNHVRKEIVSNREREVFADGMPIRSKDEQPSKDQAMGWWAGNGTLSHSKHAIQNSLCQRMTLIFLSFLNTPGILTHFRKSHKISYVASKRSRRYALALRSLVDWIRKKMGVECYKTDYISFVQQFTGPKEPWEGASFESCSELNVTWKRPIIWNSLTIWKRSSVWRSKSLA